MNDAPVFFPVIVALQLEEGLSTNVNVISVSSQLAEVMIPGSVALRVAPETPSNGVPRGLKDGKAQLSVAYGGIEEFERNIELAMFTELYAGWRLSKESGKPSSLVNVALMFCECPVVCLTTKIVEAKGESSSDSSDAMELTEWRYQYVVPG